MTNKRSPPVAVCTRCGKTTVAVEAINQRCYEKHDRKRCKGVFGSRVSVDDWTECGECKATGRVEGVRCDYCGGYGWQDARRQCQTKSA